MAEGVHGVTKYENRGDKIMRMHSQSAIIEGGFVHVPHEAHWLVDYVHELTVFPNGKFDDQVDATSQALEWMRRRGSIAGWLGYYRDRAERATGIKLGPDGKPAPVTFVRMRAPQPYANFYVSGANGRAGRYCADGNGIIDDVHSDDVARLLACGCTIVTLAAD